MKIIVTSCNKSAWTLKPFSYLFNIFWSSLQNVTIVTEQIPPFALPPNFTFHTVHLDKSNGWPRERWTDGLIKYLHSITDQQVLIMLDDYWLIRTVDHKGIGTLSEYMRDHPNVTRIDLVADRLFVPGCVDKPFPYNDYEMYDD